MIAATPASSKRLAMSSAVSSEVSAQPSTATLPSLASSPTATRLGKFLRRLLHQRRIAHRRGADDDAVDALARASPRSSPCRGCRRRAARRARPSRGCAPPPRRSSACRQRRRRDRPRADAGSPAASKACACAAGSRLNMVARAMSPCSRRTARPSFRSMAGNRITELTRLGHWPTNAAIGHRPIGRRSGLPIQEIGDQRKPKFLALFRVELRAGHVVARDHGGDRPAIVGLGHQIAPDRPARS